jgi:CheY-like chemotaxis protein/HPt (histidine-containing phosphotransfer) domain-containing protein
VLVVDSSPVSRAVLSRDLADLGLRPVAVASGAAAVAAVREASAGRRRFAFAVVSERLRDTTLEELGARIQGAANGASPRVIAVARVRSILDGEHAGRGGDCWLAKPVTSRALVDALTGGLTPAMAAAPAVSTAEPRILVVEDDPITRVVVVKSLERLGYRADTAENGREAITRLSDAVSALVLMDCEMPEMDGFQATAEIRRAEARSGRHVPVVAMTAAVADDDRSRCLASGMDDYLAKPITLTSLAAALGRWLPVDAPSDVVVRKLSADERSAVDRAVIDDLRSLAAEHEPGFVAALVERFLKDAPNRLRRLRDGAARGDARALEVDAHALQSSTGNLGIRRMVEICRYIQVLGRSGRADAAAPLVEALEHEFYRAEPELERVRRV